MNKTKFLKKSILSNINIKFWIKTLFLFSFFIFLFFPFFYNNIYANEFLESYGVINKNDFLSSLFLIFLSTYDKNFLINLSNEISFDKYILIDPEFVNILEKENFFIILQDIKNSEYYNLLKYKKPILNSDNLNKNLSELLNSPFSNLNDIINFFCINFKFYSIFEEIDNKSLKNIFLIFEKVFNNYNKIKLDKLVNFQKDKFDTSIPKINKIEVNILPFYKKSSLNLDNNLESLIIKDQINESNFIFSSYKIPEYYLLYEIYINNINNQIRDIGLFSKILNLNKNEREKYFDIFKKDFYYPDLEYFSRNLYSNFILFHFANEKLKNFLSTKLFFIKYTPINYIYKEWEKISINNDDIPFPRTFGNKILEIIKGENFQNIIDYKKIFSDEKNVKLIFISDLDFFDKNNNLKEIDIRKINKKITKFISKKLKYQCIDFQEYKNNIEKYLNSKNIYIFFLSSKYKSDLKSLFNISIQKENEIIFNNYNINNYSLITVNFENYFSVLLISNEDYSIILRMVSNIKNIYNGDYKIKKRNIFQKIIDKILFLFI